MITRKQWNSKSLGPIPDSPQVTFLSTSADIALGGGSAGGGKTRTLLLEPLRHLDNGKFGGVIFRESYPQIFNQGALWDESLDTYGLVSGLVPTRSDPKWERSNGWRMSFRHIADERALRDWQGSQVPYFGFDELCHFGQRIFWNIALSRGRTKSGIKPYVRASCNPDPDSWVKKDFAPWVDDSYDGPGGPAKSGEIRYFIRREDEMIWVPRDYRNPKTGTGPKSITFVRMSVFDNTVLLKENPEYLDGLEALPLVDRMRLLYGDWNITASGNMFKYEWFNNKSVGLSGFLAGNWHPLEEIEWVLRADFASSEVKANKPEPDYSATCLLGKHIPSGEYIIADMTAVQRTPHNVKAMFKMQARQAQERFGRESMYGRVKIRYEQEPGSAGVWLAEQLQGEFEDYDFKAVRSTGSKVSRATEPSAEAERGKVYYIEADWNQKILWRYLLPFPKKGVKDDPVDAFSGAYFDLNEPVDTDCMLSPSERFGSIKNNFSSSSENGGTGVLTGNRSDDILGSRWVNSRTRDGDIDFRNSF